MSDKFKVIDDTVTDTTTGLTWQRDTAGPMPWEEAKAYCENLTLGGYDDWRLPTRKELLSLVDDTRFNPAIDTVAFPDTVSSYYWSSTTHAYGTVNAWCLYFYNGYDYGSYKSYTYYVRAVRGGKP